MQVQPAVAGRTITVYVRIGSATLSPKCHTIEHVPLSHTVYEFIIERLPSIIDEETRKCMSLFIEGKEDVPVKTYKRLEQIMDDPADTAITFIAKPPQSAQFCKVPGVTESASISLINGLITPDFSVYMLPPKSAHSTNENLLTCLCYVNPDSTPLSVKSTTEWSFRKLNDMVLASSDAGSASPSMLLRMKAGSHAPDDVPPAAKRARVEVSPSSSPPPQVQQPLFDPRYGVDVALLAEEENFYPLLHKYLDHLSDTVVYVPRKHAQDAVSLSTLLQNVDMSYKFPPIGCIPTQVKPALLSNLVERKPCTVVHGNITPITSTFCMWYEAAMSTLALMFPAYFREDTIVFYDRPPLAYCLIGSVTGARFYSFEIAGTAILTPVSDTFDLGSDKHYAAARELENFSGSVVEVRTSNWPITASLDKGNVVQWTTKPWMGSFYKFVNALAYDGATFLNMHRVYDTLSKEDPHALRSAYLLPAKLLYGPFILAVTTPFLHGYRDATKEDLAIEVVFSKVAVAIHALARLGLCYVDIRPPNVLIKVDAENVDVYLIDYDDCCVGDPIHTYVGYVTRCKAFFASLSSVRHNFNDYMEGYPGLFDKLRKLFGEA